MGHAAREASPSGSSRMSVDAESDGKQQRQQQRLRRENSRASRLRARRQARADDHEREMDAKIDETLERTRCALEAFCEEHFVVGASGRDRGGDGPLGLARLSLIEAGRGSAATGTAAETAAETTGAWIKFCRVCSSAGLDPLLLYQCLALKNAERHGECHQNYLNALSVAILDVCDAQENLTGGLCALEKVVSRVQRRGGRWLAARGEAAVREDVVRAVEAMRSGLDASGERGVGSSVGVVTVNDVMYVSTGDFLLDEECLEVLKVFERSKADGGVSRREFMDLLGWAEERVVDAMGKLMREGIVWWVLTSAAVRSRPPLLSLSLSLSLTRAVRFARSPGSMFPTTGPRSCIGARVWAPCDAG